MKIQLIVFIVIALFANLAVAKVKKPNLNSSQFKEKFEESYSALSTKEPQITEIEGALLDRLREMVVQDPSQARNLLVDILSEGVPVSAAFNHALGNIYYAAGEYLNAEIEYLAAKDKYESFQRAWNGLGLARFRQDDYEGALAALSKSIELGANDPETYGILGYCHLNIGNLKSAEVAYNLAILNDPANTEWTEGLGQIYMETERFQEARRVFEQLSRAYPENEEYWLLQANVWLSLDEPLKTARSIEIARRIGKVDAEAMILLGNIYLKEGVFEQAEAIYLAALSDHSNLDESRVLTVLSYLVTRDQMAVARKMMDAMEKPQDGWSRASKAAYYFIKGDLAAENDELKIADVAYQLSLELQPFDGATLVKLAQLYIATDRTEKALYLLERAEREETLEYAALMLKSQLLIDEKRIIDSLPLLERAIKRRPSEALSNLYGQAKLAAESEGSGS